MTKRFSIVGLMIFLGIMACSTVPEAVNNTGNTSTSEDTSAPALYIMKPSGNITNQTYTYSVEGLAIDNNQVEAVYISRNGSAYRQTAGTTNWSTNITDLASGNNLINVYALDKSGNTSLTQSVNIFVDTDAPVVSITSGPSNDFVTNTGFSITISTDKNYGYYSIYGLPFSQFSEGAIDIDVNVSATLKYYGSDGINTSSTQTVNYGILDNNAPIVIPNPSNNFATNEAFTATFSVNEDYGYWSTNGSPFILFTTAGTSIDINGYVELQYFGADITGNTSSTQSVNYYVGNVYVSTSGNDVNDGKTIANAVLSIQKGVELAKNYAYNNVVVEAGIYTLGAGLSNTVAGNNYSGVNINNANNINLIGGWNSGFTAQTGYSELDGSGAAVSKHIIWVQDTTNLTIDGFVIRNGNADGSVPHERGGGIYFTNVSHSLIANCILNNNTATHGGGVFLWSANSNTISGTISGNSGNGVYIGGSYNTISGTISGNNTADYGGGVYIGGSYNTISGTVSGNTAGGNGGGVHIGGSYNTISGTVSGNTANYHGGGVHIGGSYNTISGTVSGNTAVGSGGGVHIGGSYNTISGTISGNIADSHGGMHYYGGGVCNFGSTYWTGSWGVGNLPDNWWGNAPL